MATFTINDLSTQSIKDDDRILKSNSDGALSKSSFKDIKDYIFANHPISLSFPVDIYEGNIKWDENDMEAVATGKDKLLYTGTFKLQESGRLLLFLNTVIKTDTSTANVVVKIDGVQVIRNMTNQTTATAISNFAYRTCDKGTHTIEILLNPQSSDSISTLYKYNSFRLLGVQLV